MTPKAARDIQRQWEKSYTEWAVGQWVSFTDGLGHTIEAKVVNKVVKGKERNLIEYTLHQYPIGSLGFQLLPNGYVDGVALDHIDESVRHLYERPEGDDMIQRHQLVDKRIHILQLLHDDGEKSTVRLTPHTDGMSLHVDLGEGKVLVDLEIERQDQHEEQEWH